jgi:uncharacterized protein (DUF58 family)
LVDALKLGVITAILFVVAVVNDWSTPDRLIVTLGAALLICWIWSRFSLQRIGLRRSLSIDRLRVGEWVSEDLTLTNYALLPKLWVESRDLSSLPGHHAGRVVHLGSRGEATWNTATRCDRRGRYRLGPIVLTASDPLGLFEQRRSVPATHEIVVYPPRVDVSEIPMPMANLSGGRVMSPNAAAAAHTIAGIRDYHVGDPLNRISWNATARMGRMMVKEFDPDPSSDIWIILDLSETSGSPSHDAPHRVHASHDEKLEYAIAVAGSLAETCLDEGRKVGLVVNRSMPIRIEADSSQRQWFRIFETLAVATAFGSRSLHDAILADSSKFTRNSGLIVITSRIKTDWVVAARSLVQRQVPVTAVFVADRFGSDAEEMSGLIHDLVEAHVATIQIAPGERLEVQHRSVPTVLA